MKKKKLNIIIPIIVIVVCCIIAVILLILPSKIGDIIYGHSTNNGVSAIQIIESGAADAPINTYYTDSKSELKPFIDLISDFDISLSYLSLNGRSVIEHPTTLYDITIYKEDEVPVKLAITPEGKLYTQYAVYSLPKPESISSIMSLATVW